MRKIRCLQLSVGLQCPRYSWVCAGIATGDPSDAEQREGKLLAVAPMKNVFNVLSKTRSSEPACGAEQRRSHRGSKKNSAVRWQVQEYVGARNPEVVCGLEVGFWSSC